MRNAEPAIHAPAQPRQGPMRPSPHNVSSATGRLATRLRDEVAAVKPCSDLPWQLHPSESSWQIPDSSPTISGAESSSSSVSRSPPKCQLEGCSLAFLDCISYCASDLVVSDECKNSPCAVDVAIGVLYNVVAKARRVDASQRRISRETLQAMVEADRGELATDSPGEGKDGPLSFAELALRDGLLDCRERPAFAKATHFVSHAWRFVFPLFVEAIRHWLEACGIPEDEPYFWVDAFVVNLKDCEKQPQEWWATHVMQAIGEIGNTILVLEPWHDPVPFKRAWVIWELYCTSVTGARLHITMTPDTMTDFHKTLVNSFETVQTALSTIDLTESDAVHQSDQEKIHNEVQRTIGFTQLNELIQTRLMQWLVDTTKAHLQSMKVAEQQADAIEPASSRIKLEDNLARMLRETGNFSEAELRFDTLLREVTAKLGTNHLFTLSCMNQLAVTHQKMGKTQQAMEGHRKCLHDRVQKVGPEHADALQSTSNLAILLTFQKPQTVENFEEALLLYRHAISGRKASKGPRHPTTLYTTSNLGKLLSDAPTPCLELFREAEAVHQHSVEKLVEILHRTHPITLTAMHNQACHWLSYFQFQSGLPDGNVDLRMLSRCTRQLHTVHTSRKQKLGKQHPDTLLTEKVLSMSSRMQHRRSIQIVPYSWAELCCQDFTEASTFESFRNMRKKVRDYGIDRIRYELVNLGIVDPVTDCLTVGMQPFNIFARLAAGVQTQPGMQPEQAKLGKFQDKFMVACNRREDDEMWNSCLPAWVGKASMSKRHRFLTMKGLHWEWFNVLSFGLVSGLHEGLRMLRDMKEAAYQWARTQGEWSGNVGLYVHVYPYNSVPSMHVHILDLDCLGPTWDKLRFKNLRIEDAIAVIEAEVCEHMRYRS